MNTSDYLKTQTNLLLCLDLLRDLDLDAFVTTSETAIDEGGLTDAFGRRWRGNPESMKQIAIAAKQFRATSQMDAVIRSQWRQQHA